MHFLLHHRGRCYAERGQTAQARDCFSQALAIREQLGDERFITSTRNALTQLPAADRRLGLSALLQVLPEVFDRLLVI